MWNAKYIKVTSDKRVFLTESPVLFLFPNKTGEQLPVLCATHSKRHNHHDVTQCILGRSAQRCRLWITESLPYFPTVNYNACRVAPMNRSAFRVSLSLRRRINCWGFFVPGGSWKYLQSAFLFTAEEWFALLRREQTSTPHLMMEKYDLFMSHSTRLSEAQTAGLRKGCWRTLSWPNLRYYIGICLNGLRKTTKNLSQDNRSPTQDLLNMNQDGNHSAAAYGVWLCNDIVSSGNDFAQDVYQEWF